MKINQRFPPELLQVLTHFYRGEVQRSTDWRQRLDITTNWAIITMTAAFSWGFAGFETHEGSHLIFIFTSLVVFLLLTIEARRYRYFDVFRTRVRMLEVHLLVPSLNPEHDIKQGDWREVLSEDLLAPTFKISFREAVAKRLIANYVWIFVGLLVGWALRVYTATPREPDGTISLQNLYIACGYSNRVPPWLIVGCYAAFWLVIIVLLATTWKNRNVTGEIRRRDRKSRKWPI